MAKFFAGLDALEFQGFQPLNFLSGGDQVAAVIRADVRNKATDRVVHDCEVHLWTFGPDGKVTRFHHAVDRHAHVCAGRGEDTKPA